MMLANPTRQMFAQQQTSNMDGAGMDHRHPLLNTAQQQPRQQRKRKAEAQPENNERLSKRMSLLNLEHGGTKLYVPVENPQSQIQSPSTPTSTYNSPLNKQQCHNGVTSDDDDDIMHLDDSKHKVYIYNLDDELSSESEAEDGCGRMVFLPDIEKHLRDKRILPSYMLNNGLSAGPSDPADMALVLYQIPSSISVPEEQDSVRKAIIEARARMRERQLAEQQQKTTAAVPAQPQPVLDISQTNGFQSCAPPLGSQDDDPDAMELD
ncbi:hypothetical protein QBC37DRAFT_179697 [Rhypophila decipiens]|uniref:Uncharacterized protein n=1 Tax=Rhypophila decipiens TaxID=261697 RepID=A0AAN6YHN8_9PEZI|nr:hypothetical protein QBC37DRAFT_179697 [Rhypophila decipiens]